MKNCIRCGIKLDDNAKFCGECGLVQEQKKDNSKESAAKTKKRFCHQCGAKLSDGVKFCGSCGTKQITEIEPKTKPNTVEIKAARGSEVTISDHMPILPIEIPVSGKAKVTISDDIPVDLPKKTSALAKKGEIILGEFGSSIRAESDKLAGTLAEKAKKSTIAVLLSGLFGTVVSLFKAFTSIKALLATLIVGGFWALFPMLADEGVDFPQWFTTLTMAKGSAASDIAGSAALFLGRFSLLSGIFALPKLISKNVSDKLKGGSNKNVLIGFGLALAVGSFASTTNFVGAIAMMICSLAAGKAQEGFLWDLAESFGLNNDAKQFMNGATAGFAMAAAMGAMNLASYGIGAGAVLFILFALFGAVKKPRTGVASLVLMILLSLSMSVWPVFAADAEWVLYDTRVDASNSTGTLTVTDGEDTVLATDTTTITLTSPNTAEIYYSMMGQTKKVQWDIPPSSFPIDQDIRIAYSGNDGFKTNTIFGTFGDGSDLSNNTDIMNLPFFMSSDGVTCNVPMFRDHNGPLYITIHVNSGSMSGASLQIIYEYRRSKAAGPTGSNSETVDTEAGDETGDDESSAVIIPEDIVDGPDSTDEDIPGGAAQAAAAVIAAGAAAGGAVKKGKKKEDSKKEKENPKSTYRMILTKDFGDTIEYDADPVPVYARIVEIKPDGTQMDRSDLTARISIFSAGILDVSKCTMTGKYMGAMVSVKTTGNMDIKSEEQISVRFDGPEGSFQNNITFKLIKKEIIFPVDNLTFPANYQYSTHLPIAIIGLSDKAVVTAKITPKGGFSLSIERDAEDSNLWYADITETGTAKKPAGTFEPFTLSVNAVDGDRKLEGNLDVFRFHTGLSAVIQNGDIACYIKDGKPVQTVMTLTLFSWNEETHEVIKALPIPTDFQVKAETGDICDKLKIGCEIEGVGAQSTWQCKIAPCAAVLDAPARHKAEVTVTAVWNEETYTTKCEVLLISQPRREKGDAKEFSATLKEDERIGERLSHIKQRIWNDNYMARLFPLYKVIETMLDGYDADFGYDPYQVDMVAQIYNGFMNGSIIGANADPGNLTLMGELRYAAMQAYEKTDESVEAFENSLGFWKRLMLGCATLGLSEVTFTSFKVPREMKRYVDQGGNSAIEGFWVGTKIVVFEYLAIKAVGGLMKGAKKLGPLAKEISDGVKVESKNAITKFTARLKATSAQKAISAGKTLQKEASQSADDIILKFRKTAQYTADDLANEQAFIKGRAKGLEKMQELARARAQIKQNPMSAEARENFERLCKEVQSDKHAMHQLQHYKGMYGDDLRAEFNRTWKNYCEGAELDSINEISTRLGVPRDSIEVLNVSGNNSIKISTGRSLPMDHDVTFVYVTKNGKVDVNLKLAEEIYNKNFYRRTMGVDPPSAEAARKHALKFDQSVVADGSLEKYGPDIEDVKRMLDIEHMGEKLSDASAIKKTVVYKSEHFMKQAKELIKQAENAPNRDELLEQAQALIEEANRQSTKQAKRSLLPREIAAKSNGGNYEIPKKTRIMIELMKKVGLGEQGPLGIEPGELDKILREEFGVTLEEAFDQIGDCFVKIDAGRV